jgi:hypothetical protein
VVVLRTPGTVVARDVILATDVTNIVGCILGTAGYGQLVALTDKSDATNYANTFGNADTTNGRAVKIQYGASTALATFAKAAISLELPATIKHADPADPAATYTSIGARASDGRPVYRISGGSALALANTGEIVSATVLSTTGDILYASAANTPARLGIGTARQVLATNAATTAPEWVASLQSLMTAAGDIVYASGANTPARLAKATDGDYLRLASGVPAWQTVSAASSLDKLAEVSGTGASGVLEFSSISGAYRELLLVFFGRSDAAATASSVRLTFEAVPTAGAYDDQYMVATNATPGAAQNIGTSDFIFIGYVPAASSTANLYSSTEIRLTEYANTTTFKMARALAGGTTTIASGGFLTTFHGGVWESTAAIDRVRLTLSAGNWTTTTRATLYGLPA